MQHYDEYSEGESLKDETREDFSYIKSSIERNSHIKELWRKCWLRSLGGSYVIRVMRDIHD